MEASKRCTLQKLPEQLYTHTEVGQRPTSFSLVVTEGQSWGPSTAGQGERALPLFLVTVRHSSVCSFNSGIFFPLKTVDLARQW